MDVSRFKPKTVYVSYIAASPQQVWDALTRPEFTRQYFFGRTIEIEPKEGGSFVMRMPDGRVDVKGIVAEWSPPHRLAVTWLVDWNEDMRDLPESLVTYEIAQAGESVRLTMPRDVLATHPDMREGGYSQGTTMASQSGRFRPIPELSGYRTVLPNLYNCSSSMHSGSGIGRGNSLNCWRTIAADLAALMTQLGHDRFAVVGHDRGCYVAHLDDLHRRADGSLV